MNLKRIPILIFLGLFVLINGIAQESPGKLKVVTEQANIRLEPDIGSTIIHQAPQGTIFEAIAKQGEWYQVKLITEGGETKTGFVHESLVLEIEKPPDKKPEEKPTEIIVVPEEKVGLEEKVEPEAKKPIKTIPVRPVAPPQEEPARPLISLSLSGGIIYALGGDINEGTQGIADYFQEDLQIDAAGDIKPIHLTYIFGGDIQFPLHPKFSLGVGADYFIGKMESSVTYSGAVPTELKTQPEIKAIPLNFFFSYHVSPQFYIKTGITYCLATCTYSYRVEQGEFWQEWKGDADGKDIGFLAGFGILLNLSPNFGFLLETTGQYAQIKGFEGTNTYHDSNGLTSTEEGKLWIYRGHVSEEDSYPLLFIRENKPTEANVSDARLASIDFSGLSLKFGIRIRF
jgi:hypothetical protein